MQAMRSVLLSLLFICDPLLKLTESWGLTNLLQLRAGAPPEVCEAGQQCESDASTEESDRFRGVEEESQQDQDWMLKAKWYRGTLCASIGLAARWVATATVAIFILQLLVWTCNWVLVPTYRGGLFKRSIVFRPIHASHGPCLAQCIAVPGIEGGRRLGAFL